MRVTCYTIQPKQPNVGKVLRWCWEEGKVDRMLLALRLERNRARWQASCPQQYRTTLELFGDSVINEELASGWPGTTLHGAPGLVLLVRFDEAIQRIVSKAGPRFSDWMPDEKRSLPEDICLFRVGASCPTLITTTHENDAWLLTEKEVELAGVSKCRADEAHDVMHSFFDGPWFCRRWRGKK